MVVSRSKWVIGIAAVCAALGGCAAKSTGGGGASGTTGGGGGSPGGNDTAAVGSDLTIVFSPMYSGYDDGMHTFKIPAVVQGIGGVKWSASDRSFVDLEDDAETGGVMITTRKAGEVKIIARAGSASGSADLHITHFGPDDCKLGGDRYNNQVIVMAGANGLPAGGLNVPENASCANCHGDGAMFLDVQHTPQQTGGYADADLINIFTQGYKPDGSVFHTMIPPQIYQRFHTWDATDPEKMGLVCYLRSLEPKTQGMIDFGGRGMGMGGMGRGMMGAGGTPGGGAAGAPAAGGGGTAGH